MTKEKNIVSRQMQKTDTTANWNTAGNNGFTPKKGEIIVYQDGDTSRIKIGDGINTVDALPFVAGDKPTNEQVYAMINESIASIPMYKGSFSTEVL